MVFSPHPDDDLLGCGGSIAKQIDQGNEITVVYMTSGEAGSLEHGKEELAEMRKNEAREAAEIIGTDNLIFLDNPDGFLTYGKDEIIELIDLIREVKPHVVYVPHGLDVHKDHKVTNDLVIEAVERAGGPWFQECGGEPWSVQTVLCYEVWTPLQEISYVEDITEFMELKTKALKQHESQIQERKYDEAIEGLNGYRGAMTGQGKYCECFQVFKMNKF